MGGAIALSVTLACQDAAANSPEALLPREMLLGAVLLAPMTNIAEKSKPSPWMMPLLQAVPHMTPFPLLSRNKTHREPSSLPQGLACMPGIRSIGLLSPSGLDPDKQYADPERRRQFPTSEPHQILTNALVLLFRREMCVNDALTYQGSMCLATGSSLLRLATELHSR